MSTKKNQIMKTKFKAGDNIQCYDPIITFKGTIRGTGTILWGSCDSIKTPKEIYLIEGTQDNETIVEWFEVLVSTLDNMESSEIEIISDAMSGFISSKNKKQ